MNRLIIFIAVILVFAVAGCGQGDRAANNSLFETSTKNMNNEKYAEALTGFQHIESAGIKTPALYNNIGVLYFKSHQMGKAILYFEKGLLVAPLDTELVYNRDKVLSKLTSTVEANNFSYDSGRDIFYKTLDVLNMIAIADVMIAALLFLFFLLKPAEQTKFYNTKTFRVVLAASISIVLVISVVVKVYEATKYAIVVTPDATIYLGPSAQSKTLTNVNEGYKIEVTNKFDGWFEIKDAQGKTGWMSADKLGEIKK